MSEQQTIKVYELAKEVGTDSISLLEKLKSLDIKVKTHMSSLSDEQADAVRTAYKKKGKTTKPRAKKSTGEPKTKKVAKSAIIRKRATGTSSAAKAEEKPAAVEKKAASATVVRKKTTTAAKPPKKDEAPAVEPEKQAPELKTRSEAPSSEQTPSPSPKKVAEASTPATAEKQPEPSSVLSIVKTPKPKITPIKKSVVTPKAEGTDPMPPSSDIIRVSREKLDRMAEEEAAKKKGFKEKGVKPEDVHFADYRKKEVFFLPKKKRIPTDRELKKTAITTPKAHKRVVEMQDMISVQELASQLGVKTGDVIKKLMNMGQMVTMNQSLDFDTVTLVAAEFQYEVKSISFKEEDLIEVVESDPVESLKPRPPVVTIMGHVDHGKTSLLDTIKESNVVEKEAGGITQHIGAYTITKNGKMITFIDTPGHEAFTSMRARGTNVTDLVVLVVAADDGVMPQTREAVSHAQAAEVPIVVAVNKIDKPGANPERIMQALSEINLLSEEWGGDTMYVQVSATKKTNIDKLLEAILLNAEMLDLKANPDCKASGTVLEARLEKGRGTVASVLVQRGTLRAGDPIVAGKFSGKVRAMVDHLGKRVQAVSPGMAAEVLGLEGTPSAGDRFDATETESDAKKLSQHRIDQEKEKAASSNDNKVTLDNLFSKLQSGNVKELKVVLKADVFGSVEAIKESLVKISTDNVKVNVIHAATGGVTESDILLAGASNAIVIGFNVRPETKARQVAEKEGVEVKSYTIIYELVDDVKKAMAGLLEKKEVEVFLGRAEVRQTFSVPKIGTVAGSAIIDGKFIRGASVRLLRDSKVIFEGKMSSLKRFKDDVKEVATGYECGIGIENYNDIKPGDLIEAYRVDLVEQELH